MTNEYLVLKLLLILTKLPASRCIFTGDNFFSSNYFLKWTQGSNMTNRNRAPILFQDKTPLIQIARPVPGHHQLAATPPITTHISSPPLYHLQVLPHPPFHFVLASSFFPFSLHIFHLGKSFLLIIKSSIKSYCLVLQNGLIYSFQNQAL